MINVTSRQLQAVRRDRYQKSLYSTAKYLLGYKEISWPTHASILRTLQSPGIRKLLCVPRGCFKSSIGVVAYSIWRLINNPDLRILIDSEQYENSKNFIREIKGKLEDPEVVRLFGQFRSDTNWTEGSITIKQRIKILKESSIVASGIGANKTSQHFDIIIMDDMNSHKNSQTAEQRKKVIDHYRLNHSILEPDGTLVIIGTRYAADDLIGHICDNEVENDTKGLIGNSLESDRIVEPPPPLIEKLESFEGTGGIF